MGAALALPGWLTRPALERLFASAALVVAPSRYEPFGLVPLEAMRLGTPVLAARTGGLIDNVGPESGGYLVSSHEPDAWCDAALAVLDNPEIGAALSRRGPRFVATRFDPRKRATELIELIYAPLGCRLGARADSGTALRVWRWSSVAGSVVLVVRVGRPRDGWDARHRQSDRPAAREGTAAARRPRLLHES